MEKRGVIEEGITPPEQEQSLCCDHGKEKQAAQNLEEHVTKRAAAAAEDSIAANRN